MNRKLTVMQLGSPTGLYGAERWILALVRHLDPRKITSIVASIKDDPDLQVPLCTQAAKLGIQTKVFENPGKVNLGAVTAICRYLKSQRVDILHTHGYKQDIIGLLAARLAGCRILSTPHGWSRDAGAKLQCYEGLNRMIFPFFDAVAPLSPELSDDLKKIPFLRSKRIHIANGVDVTEIKACRTIAPPLFEWKKKGVFVIGYVGQLIARKGIDTLFRAAARLDPNINFRIAIVGEGQERHPLSELARALGISEKVRFFGFQDNRLAFLNGFDLFVLPSRLEGIPRCLMEAMASGIPVVSSDIPGSNDIVIDQKTGRLFNVDDANDLCRKLNEAMGSRDDSAALCGDARQLIHQKFSAELMAKRYQRLFCRLAGKKILSEQVING